MSQSAEQVEESTRFDGRALELLERWYHVPALALLAGFMLWVRLQSYDRFVDGSTVLFGGNDPWYHLRQVTYTVHNWPRTMPFDPWTQFPLGTSQGQFGTLFDQIVATAALVVGLGNPDQQTIALTLLVAPAVLGALITIPTYLMGRHLGGRLGGLFAVVALALFPGSFLRRSLVGFSDHHVAEVLFQAIAVLATMVAIAVAEQEKPVYELVVDRDFTALRRPLGWSVLAGVALAAYMWTWPPGVMLVGILGMFYAIKLMLDYYRGVSPDHVGFVGAVSLGVGGLLMLVPLGTINSLSPSSFSLLQPGLTLAAAAGTVFMMWLAREWDDRDLERPLYPVTIVGILAIGSLVVWAVLPSLWNTIQNNVVRFIGFGASSTARTIGEAQPFLSRAGGGVEWYHLLMAEYGLLFFTAAVAAVLILWRLFRASEPRGEQLLVVIWAVFITSAAFTQIRFNYYLVVPVAVLNAYLLKAVLNAVGLDSPTFDGIRDISGYQIIVLLAVIMLLIPGLLVPVSLGPGGQSRTAIQSGAATGPDGVTGWDSSLGWMAENTPVEGTYGGADNEMAYYGAYQEGDGNYDYPAGSYGVMSWWDYGHWITVLGERIPVANPFQQQATTAAQFLLAQSESEANAVLDSVSEDDAKTRYVAVDWKMATTASNIGGKFFAPTVFHDNASTSDYSDQLYVTQNQQFQGTGLQIHTQDYYETQVAQLYLHHGSAVDPGPVVVDWENTPAQTSSGDQITVKTVPTGENATLVQRFDSLEEARAFVEEDGSAQVGGVGGYPSESVPALQHYRLVHASQESAFTDRGYNIMLQRLASTLPDQQTAAGLLPTSPAWVKFFERVPGATVEGTGPANTTVTATVEMRVPTTNETFTYVQHAETDENGEFTMVLPYSSTGYGEWGTEEGYTNVSVRATGPYEFATPETATNEGFVKHNATADVSEAKVIGEDTDPVTVELTESVFVPPGAQQNNSTEENNSSSENTSSMTVEGEDPATVDGGSTDSDDVSTNSDGSPLASIAARPAR